MRSVPHPDMVGTAVAEKANFCTRTLLESDTYTGRFYATLG